MASPSSDETPNESYELHELLEEMPNPERDAASHSQVPPSDSTASNRQSMSPSTHIVPARNTTINRPVQQPNLPKNAEPLMSETPRSCSWWKLDFFREQGHPSNWLMGEYQPGSLPGHENSCEEVRAWMGLFYDRELRVTRVTDRNKFSTQIMKSTWDGAEFWRTIHQDNVESHLQRYGFEQNEITLLRHEIRASLTTSTVITYAVSQRHCRKMKLVENVFAFIGVIGAYISVQPTPLSLTQQYWMISTPLILLATYLMMLTGVVAYSRMWNTVVNIKLGGESDKVEVEMEESTNTNDGKQSWLERLLQWSGYTICRRWWWFFWAGYDPCFPPNLDGCP